MYHPIHISVLGRFLLLVSAFLEKSIRPAGHESFRSALLLLRPALAMSSNDSVISLTAIHTMPGRRPSIHSSLQVKKIFTSASILCIENMSSPLSFRKGSFRLIDPGFSVPARPILARPERSRSKWRGRVIRPTTHDSQGSVDLPTGTLPPDLCNGPAVPLASPQRISGNL